VGYIDYRVFHAGLSVEMPPVRRPATSEKEVETGYEREKCGD